MIRLFSAFIVRSAAALSIGTVAIGVVSTAAFAAPKPKAAMGHYDLSIMGFNEGDPYRLQGAEAEAVLSGPKASIFKFDSPDWMKKRQKGDYVELSEVAGRFPHRRAADLFRVYQVDLDGDGTPEMLVLAEPELVDHRHRYAPTVLKLKGTGYTPIWAATALRGERYRVVDIRDLNADSRPEMVLSGQAGEAGAYEFLELVGQGQAGFKTLPVAHTNSAHYVDLDGNGEIEIVVRRLVGRRGPASQWTYVDMLHRWNGTRFVRADERFRRYHDEQTLPTLLGDLIDLHDAKLPILEEKIRAIQQVREEVRGWVKKPRGFHAKKVKALRLLKRRKWELARDRLTALDTLYPYDLQLLVALAEVSARLDDYDRAADSAIRALTVDPTHRQGWWWAGVAFTRLKEQSAATASLYNAVNLCGRAEDGVQFLRARRGERGMDAELQAAIDSALLALDR